MGATRFEAWTDCASTTFGTRRSRVLVGADDEGKVVISTREAAYKTRNLRRDPTAVLCVLSDDDFFGRWMQMEGTAQIISLPEAMAGLVDHYRRISGEHPDWNDYRRAMQHQQRVLIRVSIDAVGPPPTPASQSHTQASTSRALSQMSPRTEVPALVERRHLSAWGSAASVRW